MAITTSISNAWKQGMLAGTFNVGSDTFKIALYTTSAVLDATTGAYTVAGECTGTNYTAGGIALTGAAVWISGNTVGIKFNNPTFVNIAISDIRGFMIYDSSKSNSTLIVFDLGQSFDVPTPQNFTLQFPVAAPVTGLIQFP